MKKYIIATFDTRLEAEKSINRLHSDLGIEAEEISYLYRNDDNEIKEVSADDVSDKTVSEGAVSGAVAGGSIGAIAGIATVAGLIPVIGPIFAAGPLVTALGIGAGAVGTTAAGAVTGAATGGIVGALAAWSSGGITEARAKEYEDMLLAGNVLVAVHTGQDDKVEQIFRDGQANTIDTFSPAI